MIQTEMYLREIINFLRSVTIKNKYFVNHVINNQVSSTYHSKITDYDNPYYRHLCGEYILKDAFTTLYNTGESIANNKLYTSYDEMMYVVSFDTLEEIEFTRANLLLHPKTYSLYKIPNNYYFSLCEKYPNQIDLIKSILYPVDDIDTAISAKNFTLLKYDDSLLDANERVSMISCLYGVLDQIAKRWDVIEYTYEDLYSSAHWYIVWNIVFINLFTQRIKNIRTSSAHTYHIWEYLISRGMDDYRDVLTTKQQLFLYRNLEYLLANRGKTSNLNILADVLLKDFNVQINAKSVLQSTVDTKETCKNTPYILSETINKNDKSSLISDLTIASTESLENIINREFDSKLEPDKEKALAYDTEVLSNMGHTYLPTKLLELNKIASSSRFKTIYLRILTESTFYRAAIGDLNFLLTISTDNKTTVTLSANNAIALLLYCIFKEEGISPKNIPAKADLIYAYKRLFPDIPKYIKVDGINKRTSSYLVDDAFKIESHNDYFDSAVDFAQTINDQAMKHIDFVKDVCNSGNYTDIIMFDTICRSRFTNEVYELNLVDDYTTYETWFANNEYIKEVIETIEQDINKISLYNKLCNTILEELFPITNPYIDDSVTIDNKRYRKLKNLFVELCSYLVAFIDNTNTSLSEESDYRTTIEISNVIKQNINFLADDLNLNITVDYVRNEDDINTLNLEIDAAELALSTEHTIDYSIEVFEFADMTILDESIINSEDTSISTAEKDELQYVEFNDIVSTEG